MTLYLWLQAGIPAEAAFFCFCYPLSKEMTVDFSELDTSDPFVSLLICGGFLYLNDTYDVVAVNSFFFGEVDYEMKDKSVLCFGRDSPMPESSLEVLSEGGRLQAVTVAWLNKLGFQQCAWVCPSEVLGDDVFPPHGGFAYMNNQPAKSCFVPVVRAEVGVKENNKYKDTAPEKLRFVRPGACVTETRYLAFHHLHSCPFSSLFVKKCTQFYVTMISGN